MDILATIAHWFSRGGIVMYLLLLCSILSLAIIIERLRYYKKKAVNCKEFVSRLEENMAFIRDNEKNKELQAGYSNADTAAGNMVAAGFQAYRLRRNPEKSMEMAAQLEAARLKKGLSVLGMIVTLAPILGLMGTVIGMIQSFSVFNLQQGSPMAITGGVGEALVATATGLAVAVIALLGHSFFGYWLDNMMNTLEQTAAVFMEALPMDTSLNSRNAEERLQTGMERRGA